MTALLVETTANEPCPLDFQGDTAPLVYLMSFAVAERFGAQHELSEAAAILKRQLKINLAPLQKFGDAEPEGPADLQELEGLWQEPGPLAETANQVADALCSNPKLRRLTAGYPGLPDRLQELARIARWANERQARIRLTYLL
ncbi:MAG TPA: hypothetical protein VNL15_04005 [Dehalococcoidia bacterium]|nr:hypothetical protein [Dehalococcoidia bacterium]